MKTVSMELSLKLSRICFSDHKSFYFCYPQTFSLLSFPPCLNCLLYSPSSHITQIPLLCTGSINDLLLSLHSAVPVERLCTHIQKVLLALEALRWNMSVKRLLETTYTMPKNHFCNYVMKISHSEIGQVYASFLGCQT